MTMWRHGLTNAIHSGAQQVVDERRAISVCESLTIFESNNASPMNTMRIFKRHQSEQKSTKEKRTRNRFFYRLSS